MPDPDAPPSVLVKTFLRPYTYRQLTGHAAQRGLTLSELLSLLADASLQPVDGTRRRRRGNGSLSKSQQAFQENPDDPRHGTVNGYNNLRCRCDACRFAISVYKKAKS